MVKNVNVIITSAVSKPGLWKYYIYFLKTLFSILLAFAGTRAFSQVTITSSDSLNCSTTCTTLTAHVAGNITNSLVPIDDQYTGLLPIGFTFKYYGINYTQLVIGSNGTIDFNATDAGQYAQWTINSGIAGSTQSNSIGGPWCDIFFTEGGTLIYSTNGVAPNRKYVVTYCHGQMYNTSICPAQYTTSQIILYETTNVIEVHLTHKTICTGWNNASAIIGVVNLSGSVSTTAPGRDYMPAWSATDEAWRFTPASGGATYSVSAIPYAPVPVPVSTSQVYWYNANTGAYIDTGITLHVCPTTNTTYKAAALGCSDSTFGYYTVTAPPFLPAINGTTHMCTGTTTQLTDAVVGGTWSSSSTSVAVAGSVSGVVSGITVGNAVISYSVSGRCTATATVTVNQSPSAIAGGTGVCVGSTTALSDSVTGGAWSTGSPSIATVTGAGIVSGASAGSAAITYTMPGNCFVTTTVTVNPSPQAIAGNTSVCAGFSITLSDSPAGGTWASSSTGVATIIPGPSGGGVVAGAAAGTAIITYTLPAGCYKTITVTVNPQPSAISGVMNVCTGSTTILSDTLAGGVWSSGASAIATVGSATGVVSGVSAGITVITYTTAAGCSATGTVTVNQSPIAITGDTAVCTGFTVTLSDSPAGGTWSSNNTSIATITPGPTGGGVVSGVTAGTAIITYTLPGNCFITTTVNVNQQPSAITGIPHVCTGLTTVLSDTLSGGVWSCATSAVASVGSSSGVVTGVAAGVDIISYARSGCFVTASVTVDIQPAVAAGSPNICTDGTATLTATPGGGVWGTSNTSVATITPLNADSARIVGINTGITVVTYSLSGCIITKTVTAVSILPPVTGPGQVCTGQSIALSNTIIGGTWTSTNTSLAMVDDSAGVVTGVSPGIPTISYTIGGSCISSTTIMVNQSPDHGTILGLPDLCIGRAIALSDTMSGGIWSVSNDSASISGTVVTGVLPGRDTVRYIVSNANCTDTATKIITIYAVPNAGAITGASVVCTGFAVALSDNLTGGIWSSISTVIATIGSAGIVTGISAGTDTVLYVVSNPGCSDSASHVVTVYDIPPAGLISGIADVCENDTFRLSDSLGGGVWSSSNTSIAMIGSSTGIVQGVAQGTTIISYVVGPNGGGCIGIATDSIKVYQPPQFTINSTVTDVTCNGDKNGSIKIDVDLSNIVVFYTWSNGGTGSLITSLDTGVYILTVIYGSTPCKSRDTFRITQPDSLLVTSVVKNDICGEGRGRITLDVTGGTPTYSYLWSNNGTDKDISGLTAGVYSVTVTDSNNCMNSLPIIAIADTCLAIVVHDVITPNGDGINDVWVIEGIENYPANKVQIFDKWGDVVYEQANYSNNWGGNGRNGLVPDGTYFYLIKLNTKNGVGGGDTFTGSMLIKR